MYCELRIDSKLLVDALERSRMTARMYNFNHDGESVRAIVRVQCGDIDVFEAGLEQDSLIDTWDQIHVNQDACEYRIDYSRDMNVEGYERIFSHSGSLNQAVYRTDWRLHMFFPKRDDLVNYERELENLGFQVSTERILQSHPLSVNKLTEKQWEIVHLAKRRGYFEVPRNVELSELADELDISTASAGERLRRGIDNVISVAQLEHNTEID